MKQMTIIKDIGQTISFNIAKFDELDIPIVFRRIIFQNHRLIEEMKNADFDGFIRLDPTLNQAVTYIHQANEVVAKYPQGSFPIHLGFGMIYSTMHLLKECEKRYGRVKVKAMTQAFRKIIRLWFYTGKPRCPSALYLKKLFQHEEALITAICDHNKNIEERVRTRRPVRNPRKGSGLHGTRTKCMLEQMEEFRAFIKTNPISEVGQDKTVNARARQFWAANKKRFERAANAKGEKRGYKDSNKLASAYRASRF